MAATAGLAAVPRAGHHMVRRLLSRPAAVASLGIITVFVVVALFAPLLAPYKPNATDFTDLFAGPSRAHLLGTNELGIDVLSQLLYGARVSLLVGVAPTLLVVAVAVPLGLLAGYYRGWTDMLIARLVDVLLAFPYVIIAVGVAVTLGPSLATVVLVLTFAELPWLIRIIRGEVLALREYDYVASAVLDGAGDATILFRHILPNLISPLLVQATLLIPYGILGEALLSFLGLGVRPPTVTWGVMIASAQSYVQQDPALAVVPGVAIALVTFSFNLLGDALRDVLDPRSTR